MLIEASLTLWGRTSGVMGCAGGVKVEKTSFVIEKGWTSVRVV